MHRFLPLTLPLLAATLCAQEAEPVAPPKPEPQASLAEAIARMCQLPSVTFQTTEQQDSAMSRKVRRQMGGLGGGLGGGADVGVSGTWTDGILQARVHDDADQILSYRGRLIARNDNTDWKLRHDRTVKGRKLPFVLDPARFFEALAELPKNATRVRHHADTTYKDQELMLVGITLTDEDAQEFALSGALPAVSSGMGSVMVLGGLGAGGLGQANLPDLTVDLSLYLDPKTGFVHRVMCQAYQKGGGNGAVQIQIGGAGGGFGGDDEEEEEEVKEKDEQGKRIYKRGLPVRRLRDDVSRLEFDIRFSKHGMPAPLKLDVRAKKLLRMGQ